MMQVAVIHTAFEETPQTVALVEVGNREGTEALEYAYRRTQNIEGSWSGVVSPNNPDASEDVTVMTDLPVYEGVTYGLRSTSVGDQMLLGNEKYRVARVGFESIVGSK